MASGDTTLAPSILPRLSQINFTNPLLKSSVLLRATRFSVAIEVLNWRSRFMQSSSVRPTLATSGQVKMTRGLEV